MASKKSMNTAANAEFHFDRLPPQALDAEMAVLGSIMIDNECFGAVIEILDASCFYKGSHQKIFETAISLFERNDPVDIITLTNELKKQNQLEAVGDVVYLTELAESVPSSANVAFHARIVLEKYLARKLIGEASSITRECYESQDPIYQIIDRSEQRIFGLSEKRIRKGYEHIAPILHSTFEKIDSFHKRKGKVTGVATGFEKLDELTSGFQSGEFIVIAGRPSMGKTAFSLNIARHAAVEEKLPVGYFSLEMSNYQLALRMICAEARVDAHSVRTGNLPEERWQQLSVSIGSLAEAPIYIDDTPSINLLELRSKARRLKKEKKVGLILIDYLQLMDGPKGAESRQQEISMISRSLKALAKELDLPVVALSQLSRAVEVRGGERRPMLSDLRESGAIEQDADVVLFIYRPELYMQEEEVKLKQLEGKAEVIIGKQRNGPTGTIHLSFIKHWAKFENPAFQEDLKGVPF